MLKEALTNFVLFLSAILIFSATARAQETVAAAESQLLQVMIPANAQRVAPESVPATINEMFDKVTAAGEGKFRRGDSEVLLWAGEGYQKANAPQILSRLTGAIQNAGWQYSVEGVENGVTVFTALRQSPRRAVMGFYGATDEALIVAATELLPNGGDGVGVGREHRGEAGAEPARPVNTAGGASVAGTWYDGYDSLLFRLTPQNNPGGPSTGGRSHYFQYKFHPDGTFEYTGIMQMTSYNCTSTYFNDKRGRYSISGDRLTLTLTKNFWRQQNSCSPSATKEQNYKLDPETFTFNVKRNDRGKPAVCLDSGTGNGEACYEKKVE
jgi:hypothetical protein